MRAREGELLSPIAGSGARLEVCERIYAKTSALGAHLEAVERSFLGGEEADPAGLEARLFAIASEIVRLDGRARREMATFPGLRAATRHDAYRRLYWARDFIDASFAEPLTVARIAEVALISPFHFQRLFREAFGETPMQRVQANRLRDAAERLARTDAPVTQVCFDVGFESLGTFSALFRRTYGVPPSAYRKMRRIEEAGARRGI